MPNYHPLYRRGPTRTPFLRTKNQSGCGSKYWSAYLLLSVAGDLCSINSDGEEYIWTDLQTSEQLAAQNAQETQEQMDLVQDMGLEVGSLEDLTTYGMSLISVTPGWTRPPVPAMPNKMR